MVWGYPKPYYVNCAADRALTALAWQHFILQKLGKSSRKASLETKRYKTIKVPSHPYIPGGLCTIIFKYYYREQELNWSIWNMKALSGVSTIQGSRPQPSWPQFNHPQPRMPNHACSFCGALQYSRDQRRPEGRDECERVTNATV